VRRISITATFLLAALTLGASSTMVGCPSVHPAPPPVAASDVELAARPAPASPAPASAAIAPELPPSPPPASVGSAADGSLEGAAPPADIVAAGAAPEPTSACNEQAPQPFLVRASYIPIASRKSEHDRAIRYRTEHYGYVKGFGKKEWNLTRPDANAVDATFMDLTVRVNKRIVPALHCAEREIKRACSSPNDKAYVPGVLAGIRYVNTYRGGEVTNHLYGIAVDVDPQRNSCCGCVKPWKDSPICKKKTKDIWERMDMPECWVRAFEKFGFYWLGHDVLQDTMHFEFLGDPDRIVRKP
jgi:hypothetical protein